MAKKATVIKDQTSKEIIDQVLEHYGPKVLSSPDLFTDMYISTGIYELDVLFAGGIKQNQICIYSGKSGSGKTLLAMLAQREFMRKFPDLFHYWQDIESQYDVELARDLGLQVDNPNYKIQQGIDSAEANHDTVLSYVEAKDFGSLGFDSVAALKSQDQINKSAFDATVGGIAKPVKSMLNGVMSEVGNKRLNDQPCLILLINRKAKGIGMFATTEFIGGASQRFNSSTILEIHRSGYENVEAWGNEINAVSTHEVKLDKKRQRTGVSCKFKLSQSTLSGYPVGHSVTEIDSVIENLNHIGIFKNTQRVYALTGEKYATKKDFADWLAENPDELKFLKMLTIYSIRLRIHNRPGFPIDHYLCGEYVSEELQERVHSTYKEFVENADVEVVKVKGVGKN